MRPSDPIELLADLVAIDSQNPDPGEARIAAHVQDFCRTLGMDTRVVEAAPGRTNVIALAHAGAGPAIGLSGHLDTKPVGDALARWQTPPLELTADGDLGYGLGTSDMKGGIAAMLTAAQAWTRTATRGTLALVLTADEEAGSVHGAHALTADPALLPRLDGLVIGEPSGITEPWERLFVVSRGICCFTVHIETAQGHSGLSEHLPTSASVAAAHAVLALHGWRPSYPTNPAYEWHPTVNSGVLVSSGVTFGVHPGHAEVACDVRTVPGMSREGLAREVEAVLKEHLPPDADWTVRFRADQLGWMEPVSLDPSHRLVAAAQQAAAAVLGAELPLGAYPGGTDATAFMGAAGIPTITSLGPGWLSVAHGPNERVGLSQVRQAAHLYHELATRFVNAEAPPVEG